MDEIPVPAEQVEDISPEAPPLDPEMEAARKREAYQFGLKKEIRSWGFWLLVWGALSLVASGIFNASWGIMLIIIGIASFFVKDIAMLVIYAVTLAWAGVWNILSSFLNGSWTWAIFSLVQFYMAVRTFQVYARFRRVRAELSPDPLTPDRAKSLIPAAGCLISVLAVVGVLGSVVVIFILAAGGGSFPEDAMNLGMNLILNLAILGFAVCLGALLSGHRFKALSIIGMVVCLLLIAGWLILLLLPSEPSGFLT